MGYSARRGFSNGSMKATGAQRQMEMQQKIAQMQEDMNAKQAEIEAREFTASVGGGVVEAKVNGKKEVISVSIKPEAVDPADTETLADLIVAAVRNANAQAQVLAAAKLGPLAGGMGVPATRATTAEELADQLRSALAEPGPHLVQAVLRS